MRNHIARDLKIARINRKHSPKDFTSAKRKAISDRMAIPKSEVSENHVIGYNSLWRILKYELLNNRRSKITAAERSRRCIAEKNLTGNRRPVTAICYKSRGIGNPSRPERARDDQIGANK